MAKAPSRTFQAVLEHSHNALGWTIARIPFDPATAWPKMIRLRIRGEITGPEGAFAFRTSLFPTADGSGFCILVNRRMQGASGTTLGHTAHFQLEPDLADRPADLPEELDAMLDDAEGLRDWYHSLTEYTRREIGKWIAGVRSDDARLRRAEQMAERMLSTMEAEVDLPPLLERAFRTQPKARTGWQNMTPAQRRHELFAVFYYRTPEARERRIARLIEAATKRSSPKLPRQKA